MKTYNFANFAPKENQMAAKKPTFPNRPCPKCGKPIHIKSKRHEECGWVMDSSAATPQKPEVSKSDAIKAILKTNPKTPVSDIVSTLAGQGMKISANYVYMIKSKAKAKRRKLKREKAMAVVGSSNGRVVANPLDLIREVKQLAQRAGGLSTLKELVDVLAE
jgi:hypothetical protein